MELKKRTEIRSMEYEDFKNNDYLERLVQQLNQDGAGIILGTVDELINWGRSNSLWSLTFGTSCCAIEFMALGAARYDMARFGFEVTRNSPRQADMIMVLGTITYRMAPVLKRLYDQMAEPKYVVAVGGCTISGGPFIKSYHVVNGIDKIIPVDVFIPGCPPRPEAFYYGMMQLQRKIKVEKFLGGVNRQEKKPEEATVSENGEPVVSVSAQELHQVAEALYADSEHPMDYLRDIVGMDWGETGLGALYLLESTRTGHRIILKTVTADREQAFLPTVSDLWKTALIKEREVFDFFGIRFLNHPDMRRIFLREDWKGYPLRKDYDMNSNPLNMENEVNADITDEYFLKPDGTIADKKNIVFDQKDFVVNIGPQHPSTHGVLRMRTSLDGENICKVDPILGYIHRGIEKLNESLTYPQTLALTDRLDYLSAHQNRHALCMCIEKAAGIEISERAQYIRTIMDELQRIDSHLLFYSCLVMDMGGLTPFFYGFREREMILDIFEETTGGRLIQNYNMIGGVQADIHPTFCTKVKEFIAHLRSVIKDYHDIFTGNVIARTRLQGVGILSREDAISLGCTGGTGRASGWANDVRKHHPYALYDKVDFKEITYTEGDSFARYMVRMDEIMESCHIIEQLIDNIPAGEYKVKTKPILKLPEGVFTSSVETSRGEFDVVLESHGDKTPYRLHYRSTGLPLVHAMDTVCRGQKIADLIAIGGTLDFVIPDIDR